MDIFRLFLLLYIQNLSFLALCMDRNSYRRPKGRCFAQNVHTKPAREASLYGYSREGQLCSGTITIPLCCQVFRGSNICISFTDYYYPFLYVIERGEVIRVDTALVFTTLIVPFLAKGSNPASLAAAHTVLAGQRVLCPLTARGSMQLAERVYSGARRFALPLAGEAKLSSRKKHRAWRSAPSKPSDNVSDRARSHPSSQAACPLLLFMRAWPRQAKTAPSGTRCQPRSL